LPSVAFEAKGGTSEPGTKAEFLVDIFPQCGILDSKLFVGGRDV
jgi:hypothetical protein